MPTKPPRTTIADTLREAIRDSGLSYNEVARLSRADQGTISRFMLGQRDLTLAVASRLCLVLGLGLTRVGSPLTEPLADPPQSNRKKPKKRPPPPSAVRRGQGRRIDLEEQGRVPQETGADQAGAHGEERGGKRQRVDRKRAPGGRQRKQ